MPSKKYLFILTIVIITLSNISAREFLVSTPAQITSRMSTSLPGDTLTMTNGTWNNVSILFEGSGAAGNPILLRAQSKDQVIISGTSYMKIGGNYLVVDGLIFTNGYSGSNGVIEFRKSNGTVSNYCRLTNSSIIDFNNPDSTVDNKWVSLYGQYNRVDHCYLKGKTNIGTTLVVWLAATPNYHRIDHNYFGYRPVYPTNGAETIRVGTSDWSMYDSFTTVEYNYFEKCNGEIETISNKSCGNVYRYNTFYKCQGTLTLRHGNRCTVEGNFFIQENEPNSGGIRIIGEDHIVFNNYIQNTGGSSYKTAITIMDGIQDSPLNGYFQVKRAIVAFNTLVNCMYSFNIGAGNSGTQNMPPIDCVVANNLVYSTHSPMITYNDTPVTMTYQGNIFYGATLGITKPSGITTVDPKLKLGIGGLYRPDSLTSPALNAAVGTYSYVTMDMDGQQRLGSKDIGADEFTSGSITSRPLTASDVGPYKSDFVIPVSLNLTALIEGLYNGTSMVSDTVTVELHNASSPYALVESQKGVLNSAGFGVFSFSNAINGLPYYIVIKHRNSLETWSAAGNSFVSSILTYNMTTGQTQAYGSNLILKGSKWCLFSGDVNQDGGVDIFDLSPTDNDNAAGGTPGFPSGLPTDVNGDGGTDIFDLSIVDNNNTIGVSEFVPSVTPEVVHIKRSIKRIKE
jgi:poly(beta-D-mannuronate) lyase